MVQNKCLRYICKANYNTSSTPLYKQMNILKMNDIYDLQLMKLMFAHSKNKLPPPLQQLFVPNARIHEHNTRSRNNPHIMSRSSAFISKTFLFQCPKLWSTVSRDLKDLRSTKSFNAKQKKKIIHEY